MAEIGQLRGNIQRPLVAGKLTMLRRRISSDLDELRVLHEAHWWLPSPEQIRPSEQMRAMKDTTLEQATLNYRSPIDYLLISIFGAPQVDIDGKLAVSAPGDSLAEGWDAVAIQQVFTACRIRPIKFLPNPFPYSLNAGSHHFVLWFSTPQLLKSDDEVNRDIWREIRRYLKDTKQDAVERREEGGQMGEGGAAAGDSAATLDLVDFAWVIGYDGLDQSTVLDQSSYEKWLVSKYVNPKMTIPQLAHVQVFWVETTVPPGGRPPY